MCFTSAFRDLESCGGRFKGLVEPIEVKVVEMLAIDETSRFTERL